MTRDDIRLQLAALHAWATEQTTGGGPNWQLVAEGLIERIGDLLEGMEVRGSAGSHAPTHTPGGESQGQVSR